MNLWSTLIHALRAGPRRTTTLLVLAGAVLALVPLAGRAQAGVSDYPSPLYLSGPVSGVTGHTGSHRLIGAQWPAPTASVAPGVSTLIAGTYRYVYTVDSGGETASASVTATVASSNSEVVTVSGLPTGVGTVRVYRLNLTSPTNCYARVTPMGFASDSYTDASGTSSCTNALKRSEDRFPVSSTGWTELSPGVVPPLFGNTATVPAPAAPNRKGWIVDGPGQVSFPTGPWTFQAQTRSNAADGSAALLVVGMWKVDAATGNPVGAAILPPTEQVQAPPSLITPTNVLQTVTIQVDVPAFSLEANERLYVQFWRHQTTPYLGTTGPGNRIATMFAWDGVAQITHPAASGFAVEPTPVAPAAGALTTSPGLAAVFNDSDASDSGTVEFRVCASAAAAGTACADPVDTGSSANVAKGATATWTIGAALAHAATYHWQARGRDALGGTSAWTGTRSFVVDAAPSTPAQLGPAAGAAARSLAVEASYSDPDGDAGALEIRLCSAEAAAGAECSGLVAIGWFNSVAQGENVKWAPGEPLADGVYYWQVRGSDTLGAVSAWSATRTLRIDATPPAAPAEFSAAVAEDGLTLRWLAPPGGDEIGSYVVYVDGKAWKTLGGQTFEAKLGTFDAADTRRFAVSAIDAAGNAGPQTSTLVGVPDLVGLTRDEAGAAVARRGLVLRDETVRSPKAARRTDVVVSQHPAVPTLVGTGSAVGIVLSAPVKASALLRFTAAGVSCSNRRQLIVRILLDKPARVTVTLLESRGARVASWRLGRLAEGTRRLTLRLPSSVRPGAYRVSVAAVAAGRTERLSRPLALERAALRSGSGSGSGRSASPCARP